MRFKISRNGEEFGPYTVEEIQRYIGEGSISPYDHVYNEVEWVTVNQFLKDPRRGTKKAQSISIAANAKPDWTPISRTGSSYFGIGGCNSFILLFFGFISVLLGIISWSIEFVVLGVVLIVISFLGGSGRGNSSGFGGGCGGGCGGGWW